VRAAARVREEEDDARAPRVSGWKRRRARKRAGWATKQSWAGLQAMARGRGEKQGGTGRLHWKTGRSENSWKGGLAASFSFLFSFFSYFYSSLKQANTFEFKAGFESKHPKTMHRYECYSHNYLFNLEKSNKRFFLYYISCKEE
jgi:hypothetical protein